MKNTLNDLKIGLNLKDKFHKNRYMERKELISLRHSCAVEVLSLRDKYSQKRHGERIQILTMKYEHEKI